MTSFLEKYQNMGKDLHNKIHSGCNVDKWEKIKCVNKRGIVNKIDILSQMLTLI